MQPLAMQPSPHSARKVRACGETRCRSGDIMDWNGDIV